MAPAKAPKFSVLGPWGRIWWLVFWKRLAEGEPVAGMVTAARSGRPWQVGADELPTEAERAASVAIKLTSSAFDAWDSYLQASFGMHLPKPDRVPVIFAPGALPPQRWPDSDAPQLAI